MSQTYHIVDYSIAALKSILGEALIVESAFLESKLHLIYFEEYFDTLNAKTILIEEDYVDRDFLEDYAGYYVKCFVKYKRKCRRLHFFNIKFTDDDFQALLNGCPTTCDQQALKESYLGFVVVKPLPQTIIGKTCLKTYDYDRERRHYSSTKPIVAHLFGIPLQVNTLPFQEQDSVVAACATSAIWSALHGNSYVLQHPIPSPVEITNKATSLLPLETRSLPNKGLTAAQMAYAIRSVGLEPFLVDARDHQILKETAYAYLRGGFPLILGLNLIDISGSSGNPAQGFFFGRHAVALTGYSLQKDHESPTTPAFSNNAILKAGRIDRIYVHDDQVGPFARMLFDDISVEYHINNTLIQSKSISCSWTGNDGVIGSVRAVSDMLLIPLYHKIRIPFGAIYDHIQYLNAFINILCAENVLELDSNLEWDIYLITVSQYKEEVLASSYYGVYRPELLTSSLPRFIWKAISYRGNNPVIEILFDATDIEQASLLVSVVPFDNVFFDVLIGTFQSLAVDIQKQRSMTILRWLERLYYH